MNIVIPMAGRGERFIRAGVSVPKPLIDVIGKPMYAWATESLPLDRSSQLIFLCLKDHLDGLGLREDIRSRYAQYDPIVLSIDHVTKGQACTVLLAADLIDNNTPLLIYNADTWCNTSLNDTLSKLSPEVSGVLGVFKADGDRWSFARTDDNGRVVETAEKRRISDWASTGLYYFSRGRDFVSYAEKMIRDGETVKGEFYVAPIYNAMIAAGCDIRLDIAVEAWPLGTPEDLAIFLEHRAKHEGER